MAEDWLPKEAPPVPTHKRQGVKTIIIWVVLIVMFLAIYTVYSDPTRPPHQLVGYSGWWIVAGVVGALLFAIVLVAVVWGGTAKFNQAQAAGLEALAAGK